MKKMMRMLVVLVLLISAGACAVADNIEDFEAKVKAQIEQRLTKEYPKTGVKVAKVSLTESSKDLYTGVARVTVARREENTKDSEIILDIKAMKDGADCTVEFSKPDQLSALKRNPVEVLEDTKKSVSDWTDKQIDKLKK